VRCVFRVAAHAVGETRNRATRIQEAVLEIDVAVKEVSLRSSYGHRFASAHFFFDCHSRLSTDEKTYVGHMAGDKKWGFDWYYEKLHGELPDVWPSTPFVDVSMLVCGL
jgi:hypothetical protein